MNLRPTHLELIDNPNYRLYLDTVYKFKDTLEELRLNIAMEICDDQGTENDYSSRPDLAFNKLKKFSLRLDDLYDPQRATLTADWMQTWTDAIKQVVSISTVGYDFIGSRFLEELRTTGTSQYQNLREISLTCKPEDAINFLTEITQPLKKLNLRLPLKNGHLPEFEKSPQEIRLVLGISKVSCRHG